MMKIKCLISLILCLACTLAYASDDVYYASLKKKEVNWRTGPGERYPIQWIYQEQGYPVKVLDTYDIWRQVQEADGSIGWVHKKMLSDKRTALVQNEGTLRHKPREDSRPVAFIEKGTIAKIIRCPMTSPYCLLIFSYQGENIKGWFPRGFIWGVEAGEDID